MIASAKMNANACKHYRQPDSQEATNGYVELRGRMWRDVHK
jgi:hypothetical protein